AHYVLLLSLFVSSRAAPLSLHSFPPRRSSDLPFHRQGEPLYRIFKRLFTILPSHDTGHFTYFFHKHGRIRELVKITYTGSVNPFINKILCFFYSHTFKYHYSFVSKIIVTGPSLRKSIFISAPKTPICTCLSNNIDKRSPMAWYKGSALSGFAARIKEGRLPFLVCAINVNCDIRRILPLIS